MKNEPALTESGSAGSTTMPLPRRSPSTASRTAAAGALAPRSTPERARQLAVAHRRGLVARASTNVHGEHDALAGRALERARAVAEPALRGRQLRHLAGAAVEHAHRGDRLGDLLAVGADVLDRRGADRARDAGQALDADQAVGDGAGHERRPRTRRRRPTAARPVLVAAVDPARGDPQHERRRSPRRRSRRSSRPPATAAACPRHRPRAPRPPAPARCRPRRAGPPARPASTS